VVVVRELSLLLLLLVQLDPRESLIEAAAVAVELEVTPQVVREGLVVPGS
jgi:hypothetical protein